MQLNLYQQKKKEFSAWVANAVIIYEILYIRGKLICIFSIFSLSFCKFLFISSLFLLQPDPNCVT